MYIKTFYILEYHSYESLHFEKDFLNVLKMAHLKGLWTIL